MVDRDSVVDAVELVVFEIRVEVEVEVEVVVFLDVVLVEVI